MMNINVPDIPHHCARRRSHPRVRAPTACHQDRSDRENYPPVTAAEETS